MPPAVPCKATAPRQRCLSRHIPLTPHRPPSATCEMPRCSTSWPAAYGSARFATRGATHCPRSRDRSSIQAISVSSTGAASRWIRSAASLSSRPPTSPSSPPPWTTSPRLRCGDRRGDMEGPPAGGAGHGPRPKSDLCLAPSSEAVGPAEDAGSGSPAAFTNIFPHGSCLRQAVDTRKGVR